MLLLKFGSDTCKWFPQKFKSIFCMYKGPTFCKISFLTKNAFEKSSFLVLSNRLSPAQ